MPVVIIVEGLIGAGKSTLLRLLNDRLCGVTNKKVTVIYEPVEEWKTMGILDQFYRGLTSEDAEFKSVVCYKFQSYAFISRINAINETYARENDSDIYIIERSVFSDKYFFTEMLLGNNSMQDNDHLAYTKSWHCWKDLIKLPTDKMGFLYLRPSINACMDRVHSRGRGEESKLSEQYQRELMNMHDAHLFNGVAVFGSDEYPCRVINSDGNFINDEEIIVEMLKNVADFVDTI